MKAAKVIIKEIAIVWCGANESKLIEVNASKKKNS